MWCIAESVPRCVSASFRTPRPGYGDASLFEPPVQISLPVYSLERPATATAGLPVLQADSYQRTVRHERASTLVTIYLLIADPDGGHRPVRKPPDCASAAQNRPGERRNEHSAAGAIGHQLVAASASG